MSELKSNILSLREEGFSYNEIVESLGCSKGTVSYHCGKGQKAKAIERSRKNKPNLHPYSKKLSKFKDSCTEVSEKANVSTDEQLVSAKFKTFCKEDKKYVKPTFCLKDVKEKFGENPKCYLTGDEIMLESPTSYHFDHITPKSKGGQNTLENLGLTTSNANKAKSDMDLQEFVELCKKVVAIHG